jgi:hypothetical protein
MPNYRGWERKISFNNSLFGPFRCIRALMPVQIYQKKNKKYLIWVVVNIGSYKKKVGNILSNPATNLHPYIFYNIPILSFMILFFIILFYFILFNFLDFYTPPSLQCCGTLKLFRFDTFY